MGDHTGTNVRADALQRALRTLWQGFLLDALAAIGVGLLLLIDGGDVMSPVFWGGVGALVAKSLLVSLASYLARLKVPPKPLAPAAGAPASIPVPNGGLLPDGGVNITGGELLVTRGGQINLHAQGLPPELQPQPTKPK